ncbi:hypothetical protein U1Q18_035528 [Sarracenia purpurea var. burkii]
MVCSISDPQNTHTEKEREQRRNDDGEALLIVMRKKGTVRRKKIGGERTRCKSRSVKKLMEPDPRERKRNPNSPSSRRHKSLGFEMESKTAISSNASFSSPRSPSSSPLSSSNSTSLQNLLNWSKEKRRRKTGGQGRRHIVGGEGGWRGGEWQSGRRGWGRRRRGGHE